MRRYFLIPFLTFTVYEMAAQPCSDLFISEYVEGSSFNKMIEIYNPTTGTVDLSAYRLQTYFNASDTPQYEFQLSGTLPAGDVWVGTNSSADTSIVNNIADATNSFVINWNGNDAIVLLNTVTGDTADIFGQIGDSVANWIVGSGTTQDHSLVRMATVQEGTTNWSIGATQWDVYPQNDFSHIGSHSMLPCLILPDPEVYFLITSDSFQENTISYSATVSILNPNTNATSVDVTFFDVSAVQGTDYTFVNQTITFPPSSSAPIQISVDINNDAVAEIDEEFGLFLSNPTNSASITSTTANLTILDDDGLGNNNLLNNMEVILFPNPVSGWLSIQTTTKPDWIRIKNILGEEVAPRFSEEWNHIDVSILPPGMYFMWVGKGDQQQAFSFVKQ